MIRKIKNKKGFLLGEETLKIIIAVICLLFLVYLIISVYNANSSAKKLDEAKNVLARADQIVTHLSVGGEEQLDIPNPEKWHLLSFTQVEKPNSCLNEKCLCICPTPTINLIKSQIKQCDDKGTCLIMKNLANPDMDIKITGTDPLLFVNIKNIDSAIVIGEKK